MKKILEINNLTYNHFKNFNLSINQKGYYLLSGKNNSGKTTLFNIVTGFIPTNNYVSCDNIDLNKESYRRYLKKVGIVCRVNTNSFLYTKVKSELEYPLKNLGYSDKKIEERINYLLDLFSMKDILNKDIKNLNIYEQQMLLIVLSLLHKPKILFIDGVLEIFSKEVKKKILDCFNKLIRDEDLTIINFTIDLESFIETKIILINDYQLIDIYKYSDLFEKADLFSENGLEIPFIFDLSNKLKMYNLIKDNYFDMKDMVDAIWK